MLLATAACAVLVLGAAQPESKTIPGQPGTDGSGGDSVRPVAPAAVAPARPVDAPVPMAAPAAPWPHPLITEVLYAVPGGAAGDANKDGKREVAGDEFIELVNPHDRAIQLFGYTLTDSQEAGKGQLKFTFPALELAPGGVVVVFNGFGSTFAGPVGDSKAPPPSVDAAFGGAWVFTMRNSNSKVALGNSGDHVMLTAPDGTRVQRVWWNENPPEASPPTPPPPAPPSAGTPSAASPTPGAGPGAGAGAARDAKIAALVEDGAPTLQRTSVQRDTVLASGRFVSHMDAEHAAFSPGVYVMAKAPK